MDEAFRIVDPKRSPLLTRLKSLAEFFELFPDPEVASAIKMAFEAFLEDDENWTVGEREFKRLGFYVEDDEFDTMTVDNVSVAYSEPYRLHVVEAKNGKAVLVGDLFVTFFAQVSGLPDFVEERAFVSTEVGIDYDLDDPSQIAVQSIRYDTKSAISVSVPRPSRS